MQHHGASSCPTGAGAAAGSAAVGSGPNPARCHGVRVGGVPLPAAGVPVRDRRFAPAAELLGLAPDQRRTTALSELAAGLAARWPTPRRRGCWRSWPAHRCRPAASAGM